MSGRIFQNVVLQLKENTDRTVGVIDGEGVVIACSELSMIGQRWSEYVAAVNGAAGSMVCFDGKTFKALSGWGNQFDYAVFAFGDNEISKTICSMATVALNAAKSYYEEKHDRGSFVKDIISDNIMLGDIYMRAKELRVATDVSRGIFAIRALQKGESVPTETIQAMFPDRQNDFVLSVGEGDVVLIRQLPDGAGSKELNKTAAQIEEALRVNGESTVVVGMGTIAMHLRDLAKSYYEEKHDRGSFVKDIISDNIMLGDIYMRAKELRVATDVSRGVFTVRALQKGESVPTETIQAMFPDRQNDFVLSVGEGDVVLIRQLPDGAGAKELNKIAAQIEEALRVNGESTVVVGMGTIAMHLRDLAKSYKEAQIAIEVGKVFDTEKYIINYENLGIGRLIYQLPTTLCEMFLQEVFKKNPIDALDKETLFTIHKFFENNLNVSETARKLFVHRNTLVYRLEKIKKLTGLDLREFDDAITFKVALMVKKYLTSRGIDS